MRFAGNDQWIAPKVLHRDRIRQVRVGGADQHQWLRVDVLIVQLRTVGGVEQEGEIQTAQQQPLSHGMTQTLLDTQGTTGESLAKG
ncbi:hypothetical protein D3C80_1877980 [compost metagenome]